MRTILDLDDILDLVLEKAEKGMIPGIDKNSLIEVSFVLDGHEIDGVQVANKEQDDG